MIKPNLEFVAPGPGVWELESVHLSRPLSRFHAEIFPAAAIAGFRQTGARYALLLEYMEFAVVNRFNYICPRPVGAPKGAKGPPPKFIFKVMTRLHPEMRRRIKAAGDVFASRIWREDVARWDNEWKPAIARENRELQSVDTRALDVEGVIAHLERCTDALKRGMTRHHSLNATAMLPLGDFLSHVRDWTGLEPKDVLPLFRGSSRVSQGATDELNALVAECRRHNVSLEGSDPSAILDSLTNRTDAVGATARMYIDTVGVRAATGYDVADLTLREMPELLVETIRTAVSGVAARSADEVARLERELRDRVPAQHRDTFDALLHEARLTYRIRDERAYLNDAWSTGNARRAIIAAGERLVAKGRLHDARHAVELTFDELVSMLRGGAGPSADETAAEVNYRETHTVDDAPPFLGGVPSSPPPPEWLPPAAARSARAIGIVLEEMFASRKRQEPTAKVMGYAASAGQVTGVARLVLRAEDMNAVRKGDLLVARATSPSYNALLPLIGGIVTDRGGTLSHAAVVAREYGIPAVVGTGNATELIRDGMKIRIDGGSGTVEILA